MAAFFYTYTGKNNIDVNEFLEPSNRLFFRAIPVDVFERYDDNTGMSNRDRIYAVYNEAEKETYSEEFELYVLPFIKPGTDLILPTDRITIENLTLYGDNQFLRQANFRAYWSDNYNTLIRDPNYVPANKLTRDNFRNDVTLINENIQIYIWIKAINRIYDISPFVRSVSTSKNFDVGAFSLSVDPVLRLTEITDDLLVNFEVASTDVINLHPLNNVGDGNTSDFFETNLQYNDLVFIRFERLQMEGDVPADRTNLERSSNSLPGKVWDMIGLIDTVNVTRIFKNTDKLLQIQGRDLMKLLIDDASYFIPTVFRTGSDLSFIFSGDENEAYFKRNIINGAYQYYFNYGEKSIRDSIGFIINHLANLRIIDDNLFDAYGDRISRRYVVTGADENYIRTLEVNGIWKIVKVFVDPVVDDRRIADDSLANPDGSLLNYVKRICQEPFVEFWGDTNGDQFDLIARQAPLNGAAIRSVIGVGASPDDRSDAPVNRAYINILEKDTVNTTLGWDTRYYSWYQIQAQNAFMGNSDSSSLSVIPIIWLPPYVNNFGNKRYIIADNYFSARSLKGDENNKTLNIGLFAAKVLNDLKYVIDIHSYLPFTRRGTITLIGDRRIKIGSFVRLASTNELFYVIAVSNSAAFTKGKVERATTITVERGMVIDYIRGVVQPEGFPRLVTSKEQEDGTVGPSEVPYSYFNIVDTDLITNTIIRNLSDAPASRVSRGIATDFGVNLDIFNFFQQRQQFKQ